MGAILEVTGRYDWRVAGTDDNNKSWTVSGTVQAPVEGFGFIAEFAMAEAMHRLPASTAWPLITRELVIRRVLDPA